MQTILDDQGYTYQFDLPKGLLGMGYTNKYGGWGIEVYDTKENAEAARSYNGNDHLKEVGGYWVWHIDNI